MQHILCLAWVTFRHIKDAAAKAVADYTNLKQLLQPRETTLVCGQPESCRS